MEWPRWFAKWTFTYLFIGLSDIWDAILKILTAVEFWIIPGFVILNIVVARLNDFCYARERRRENSTSQMVKTWPKQNQQQQTSNILRFLHQELISIFSCDCHLQCQRKNVSQRWFGTVSLCKRNKFQGVGVRVQEIRFGTGEYQIKCSGYWIWVFKWKY